MGPFPRNPCAAVASHSGLLFLGGRNPPVSDPCAGAMQRQANGAAAGGRGRRVPQGRVQQPGQVPAMLVKGSGQVAGAAALAVAGAGKALMPLVDKLATSLISDNPMLLEDLRCVGVGCGAVLGGGVSVLRLKAEGAREGLQHAPVCWAPRGTPLCVYWSPTTPTHPLPPCPPLHACPLGCLAGKRRVSCSSRRSAQWVRCRRAWGSKLKTWS